MSKYDPFNWYWQADDGRLYSSAAQDLIQPDDAAYIEWSQRNLPTSWPRDDSGEQTPAELQQVLFSHRIAVDLKAYAFMLRDQKEHGGMPVTNVPGMTAVRTDPYTQELSSRYHSTASTNTDFTAMWVLPDRSTLRLNKAAIDALWAEMTAFVVGTFDTYATIISDIDGGTITTIAQIDAAFGTALARSKRADIGWQS
jgi:hypothetical protein